ncbi:hypothetical protein C8Q74DRAFT_380931 [Fomes fomentarius]|nr:hypothetical protein C8Q74DRAFT_380931 [Fomes fomentarius]
MMVSEIAEWLRRQLDDATYDLLVYEIIRRAASAPFIIPAESHTANSFLPYNGLSSYPQFPANNLNVTRAPELLIDRLVHGIDNISLTGHGRGYTDGYLAPAYDYAAWGEPYYEPESFRAAAANRQDSDETNDPELTGQASASGMVSPTEMPVPVQDLPLPAPVRDDDAAPYGAHTTVEPLEQGEYRAIQAVRGTRAGPIHFNGGQGVTFGTLDTLESGNAPAFHPKSSLGVKPSMRFELPHFAEYKCSTQVPVRRGPGKNGSPVTVRAMAQLTFKELRKLMDHAAEGGQPLMHKGRVVRLDEIVLLRIEHVSQGTLQPILGIQSGG